MIGTVLHRQRHSHDPPRWVSHPPGGPKWEKELMQIEEKIQENKENEEKLENVLTLPTRE